MLLTLQEVLDPKVNNQISHIRDNSNLHIHRARVFFKNGHELSIIQGEHTSGGSQGLYEIMPSDVTTLDEMDSGSGVVGYLDADRVQYYIRKIGAL